MSSLSAEKQDTCFVGACNETNETKDIHGCNEMSDA